jgi:sulfur dioxygenase
MSSDLIFHQLFEKESSTYTYLIGDPKTGEAIIIDPVLEMVERDYKLIEELDLKLKYILETHVHADHITGSGELRKKTGAKIAINESYQLSCPDIGLVDGQELKFGNINITAFSTPGHTNGCMTYKIDEMIFTGDVLLIRGCGRTDFQDGSSENLFASVREKLFNLSDNVLVYPAHDYNGLTHSSIGMEKKFNPRLNLSVNKAEFQKIMSELKLANPQKIEIAVPANLQCGLV